MEEIWVEVKGNFFNNITQTYKAAIINIIIMEVITMECIQSFFLTYLYKYYQYDFIQHSFTVINMFEYFFTSKQEDIAHINQLEYSINPRND